MQIPDDELADLDLDLSEDEYYKAVEVFEELLKLDAKAPRSNFYLGTALYKTGEYEKAESLLINALSLDKQLEKARLSLLNVYISQERYEEALDQISTYLESYPDSPWREQVEKFRGQIKNAMNP